MEARFMSRPFSLRRSSSVFIHALLCALLLPVCVAVSAQTNRPAATQEGRQPALDPKVEKLARSVTIYRDSFGVPHIFGKTDAGVVFGLMYAQCEDNFRQLETDLTRAIGRAAEIAGETGLANDL